MPGDRSQSAPPSDPLSDIKLYGSGRHRRKSGAAGVFLCLDPLGGRWLRSAIAVFALDVISEPKGEGNDIDRGRVSLAGREHRTAGDE